MGKITINVTSLCLTLALKSQGTRRMDRTQFDIFAQTTDMVFTLLFPFRPRGTTAGAESEVRLISIMMDELVKVYLTVLLPSVAASIKLED